MTLLLLGFCAIESRNEPLKRSILWHICLSDCQVSWWQKLKGNWSEKCISISVNQNLPCMGWAETESILTVLKISVKTKLYSKLLSKNYFDYFSPHNYLLKNQNVIISWNRGFCNFKLKFSANWHWKANHWSNITK